MDNDPETLLRRLRDRDAEIGVLLQRVHLLNCRRAPPSDHGFGHGGMGSYDALKERLSVVYGCREKVEALLNKTTAAPPSSSSAASASVSTSGSISEPEPHIKAIKFLLSGPALPLSAEEQQSSSLDGTAAATLAQGGSNASAGGGGGSTLTYREFLERLTRSESEGFVKAIRLFLFSVLGNGGAVNPASGRPQSAANRDIRRDMEEVEVYGPSFLVQSRRAPGTHTPSKQCFTTTPPRCAEFFLAMQNAMGVHPSWAELGYDRLVACREHLERFVMTKIHPLAFGGKLDGAMDAAISARLRALQFLTPQELNVGEYARHETVLALAQEELRKMNIGRCPGDIVMRVERCCDILFALLDQGRQQSRSNRGEKEGESAGGRGGEEAASPPASPPASAWRPERDPAGTADDFLPVLVYVVLRARVPRLHSICEYVQAFHSPVALMSRPGYCFVALRSAVSFLMEMDGAAVGMSEQEFRRLAL